MTPEATSIAANNDGRKRQNRFGSIQRLNPALLVDGQHDCAARRIHVKSHDIPYFLDQLRIFRKLEAFHAVRLQPESPPNPHDGILGHSHLLRHQTSAPMRAMSGHRFQSFRDYRFHTTIGDPARRAYPRFIQQSIDSVLAEPLPPLPYSCSSNVQLRGDLRIVRAFAAIQRDAGPVSGRLRRLRPTARPGSASPDPRRRFPAVVWGAHDA